jgi:hypothetical protein
MDILQTIIRGITVIITHALAIGVTPIGDRIIAVMTGREKNTAMSAAATGTPMTGGPSTGEAFPIAVMADEAVRHCELLQVGHGRQRPGTPDQKG